MHLLQIQWQKLFLLYFHDNVSEARIVVFDEDAPRLSTLEVRHLTILMELPFVVSFQERIKVFFFCSVYCANVDF